MIRKYSVTLHGHRTSFSLEEEFYLALKMLAHSDGLPLAGLIARIDEERAETDNLSSALRLFVFRAAKAGRLTETSIETTE